MRSLLLSLALISPLFAAPTQEEFYLREEIPLPKGEVMEIGSIALMPDQESRRHHTPWRPLDL